jgi:hypothetical protein
VVPGHPEASELVRRIRGQALPRMPFDGPPYLSEADIALIVAWIRQGARDAAGDPLARSSLSGSGHAEVSTIPSQARLIV